MTETPKTLYRRGAEDGLIMGPLMALILMMGAASSYFPVLMLLSFAGMIAVPSLMYFMLARTWFRSNMTSTFSALWLQGICTFFFGGLIMGLLVFVALRWVWPSFIFDQLDMLNQILSSSTDPEARNWLRALDNARAEGMIPTPAEVVVELIYIVVFSGSLLSMILSAVVRMRRRPTPPPFNNDRNV